MFSPTKNNLCGISLHNQECGTFEYLSLARPTQSSLLEAESLSVWHYS